MNTDTINTWCPGCGAFSIESSSKQVLKELINEGKIKKENTVTLAGIGCHGKMLDYLDLNSFYSLHGRVIPPATGIKVANPKLTVIGFQGDGDAYGEGISHLIFAAKRNSDITILINNNQVYGLTAGQVTPTSPENFVGKSTPKGSIERPLNPIELCIASGATFVARAFSGDPNQLKQIIKEAILHKGFSIVDIMMPCVSFRNTFQVYKEKGYYLEDHDPTDYELALKKAREWGYSD